MDVTADRLFRTDSKVYSCCTLMLGPENLSYCVLYLFVQVMTLVYISNRRQFPFCLVRVLWSQRCSGESCFLSCKMVALGWNEWCADLVAGLGVIVLWSSSWKQDRGNNSTWKPRGMSFDFHKLDLNLCWSERSWFLIAHQILTETV